MPTVTLPPPQYDHYSGPIIERRLSLEEARKFCASIGITADGCAGYINLQDGSKICLIVVPLDGFDTIEAYIRHEKGHCAGWPADHTDR